VISQAKRWFVVAQVLPTLVAIAFALMIAATQADPVAYAPAGLAAVVLVGAYMSTVFAASKPYKWGGTAAWFGAYGGIAPGLAVGFLLGGMPASALFAAPTAAIGWFAGRQLGTKAQALVAELRPAELADTDLELAFPVRGKAKRGALSPRLLVGPREMSVSTVGKGEPNEYSTCLLEDVTAVERHSVQTAGAWRLPGERGVTLELTPGSAVLLREPAGEWIFPTVQAEQAWQVLSRRVEVRRARLAELLAEADEEAAD
jgi:hypothetical protein